MKKFWAKSNPRETVQEHTDKLIENFNKFKTIYPNLNVDWDILYLACLYHDLGKIGKKFQDRINNIKKHKDEIPHSILSLSFINARKLEESGYSKERIRLLAQAVAYHHERDFNFDRDDLEQEIELLKLEAKNFKYNKIEDIQVKKLSRKYFSMDRIYEEEDNDLFFRYILIKGLLNRIDYAASGYIDVEIENNFLLDSLENNLLKKFKEKDSNADWNELQKFMLEHRDNNLIITAQTGMGKTEAGLLWIGDNKGFFTLPLKTAINAMYKRITEKIIFENYQDKVGLLHSDTKREYYQMKDEIDFDEYYNKTKQLSLPLTICTLDQIFDFVYRYRGFESKLATLSYSKVVIDEVQMYAPDLLAYLVVGLSYIDKIGGKFAVLTATLPRIFVQLLEKENVKFIEPKPFTTDRIRHSIKVIHEKINADFIKKIYENNKVLVICNTVKEAQRIYSELLAEDTIKAEVSLFHSGFIKKDRKEKEEKILEFGDKENDYKGIWVTTQVVEASLDIDFDILVTELSDLNGLFQRMGRCYRDRDWDKEGYNCYVFDGGDLKCSGVGRVIDEKIYIFSKKELTEKNIDGPIREDEKILLVDSIYSLEKLRGTDYYEKLIDAIEYVKLIESYEKSSKEIKKIFRNIESKTVIPKPIYEEHIDDIKRCIEILNKEYSKDMAPDERKAIQEEKIEARINLDNFTLSIPIYRADESFLERLKINEYETIDIFDCDYDAEIGIQYKSIPEKNITNMNIDDRIL